MVRLISDQEESQFTRHVDPMRFHHRLSADPRIPIHEEHQSSCFHWVFYVVPGHHQGAGLSHSMHGLNRMVIVLGKSRDLNEWAEPTLLNHPKIGACGTGDRGGIQDHATNNAAQSKYNHEEETDTKRGADEFKKVVACIFEGKIH